MVTDGELVDGDGCTTKIDDLVEWYGIGWAGDRLVPKLLDRGGGRVVRVVREVEVDTAFGRFCFIAFCS